MEDNFLSRWSQRKLDRDLDTQTESEQSNIAACEPEVATQEGALGGESQHTEYGTSVSSLLVSEVGSSVKKAALRKLFLSGEFSDIDRLNDYDHDYQSVKSLSDDVVIKLRDWMNQDDSELTNDDRRQDGSVTDSAQSDTNLEQDTEEGKWGQNRPHEK